MVDERGDLPVSKNSEMTLDFQSYLVSASPPDFEFPSSLFMKRRRSPQIEVTGIEFSKPADKDKPCAVSNELWRLQELLIAEENLTPQEEYEGFGLTKCTNRSNDADRIKTWQSSYNNCESDRCSCKIRDSKKSRRKVTFADDAGQQLEDVLEIPESSEPPTLRFEYMSLYRKDTPVELPQAEKQQAVSLAINFLQPAADYLAFHNKVSTLNVSLENIIVRDNWHLVGTVKVKNVANDKRVSIRYTFDSWASCQDIEAHYIGCGRPAPFGSFETFSFETTVPSTINPSLVDPVQFAVCFTADGREYWDNNDGQNYKVAIETQSAVNTESVDGQSSFCKLGNHLPTSTRVRNGFSHPDRRSAFAFDNSLSEFASWNSVDNDSPYW